MQATLISAFKQSPHYPSNYDTPATPNPVLNACHNEMCTWPFLIYYQTHIKTKYVVFIYLSSM